MEYFSEMLLTACLTDFQQRRLKLKPLFFGMINIHLQIIEFN